MSIKRYTLFATLDTPESGPLVAPKLNAIGQADGEWVRYDDHAAEVERLTADLAAARAERDELADLVDSLTMQGTYAEGDPESFDSGAISAYADGLRDMARRGKVRITHDVGRRVVAEFTPEELARQEREVEEHRKRFRAALAALPSAIEAAEKGS